jgi:malic enzyme
MSSYSEDLRSAALAYHRLPRPGKLEIQAIKPLANQRDLALAYSPGVAAACTEIAQNPAEAQDPSMPVRAIHQDDVDAILDAREIATALTALAAGAPFPTPAAAASERLIPTDC